MRKPFVKKYLFKANLLFTIILVILNAAAFFLANGDKTLFTVANAYISVFIGFMHYFHVESMYKNKLADLKKEAMFINYPVYIAAFFSCMTILLIASFISLYVVNKEALNLTFVFAFFMNMIFAVFPSVLVLLFMYFIIPEFIIPSKTINDVRQKKFISFSKVFFLLFLMLCVYNGVSAVYRNMTIETQEKYKASRLTMHFSTKYLKFDENINPYSKKKVLQEKVNIPFLYTKDAVAFENYDDAKRFCEALDARIANYLEAYYIAFNKFDTFGNKYYWTSDQDGKYSLVLHFQNMSYTIERLSENTKPLVYCVADIESKYGTSKQSYFYRNEKEEKAAAIKSILEKPFDKKGLSNIIKTDKQDTEQPNGFDYQSIAAAEKKHVNFSVKEVPSDVFNELINQGYTYNPSITIKRDYETTDALMQRHLVKDPDGKEIRLCYFPFTNYDDVSMYAEAQIYKQSFCSPAFELITPEPAIKTKYEKDAYCYSRGGRLPNIPELYGILKTFNISAAGIKYWTNNQIPERESGKTASVIIINEDKRFAKIKPILSSENDSAYVYCIKKPQTPSRIIANYKSRFEGVDGSIFAKQKCPNCVYYEMPDVILKR